MSLLHSSLPGTIHRQLLTATLAVAGTFATPVDAVPPSIDGIREDARQYALWTGRFEACAAALPDQAWETSLDEYNWTFAVLARQDFFAQLGNPAFRSNDASSLDRNFEAYLESMMNLLDGFRIEIRENGGVSASQCGNLEADFAAYYGPFKERVRARLSAARDADERARAATLEATEAFEQALGKPVDETAPRRPSDVPAARRLLETSQPLREELPESGWLLCDAAGYSDPEGLRFLLNDVSPQPGQSCGVKAALERALRAHRYDNAVWLADRVDVADLPGLAMVLMQAAQPDAQATAATAHQDAARQAAEAEAIPVLERFLALGLSADARPYGESLLARAVRAKQTGFVTTLLAHGANPAEDSVDGASSLFVLAASSGDLALLRAFIASPGIRVDAADPSGQTALEAASCKNDQPALVAELLQAGARVPTTASSARPLLACARGAAIAALLVEHGADPRWLDEDGNTLLAYADSNPQLAELIPFLVEAGLPLNAQNRYGATILNYAGEGSPLMSLAEQRELLVRLGAVAAEPDRRLPVVRATGHAEVGMPYQIVLDDGRVISGDTDVLGRTSWVPDGHTFAVKLLPPRP